MTQKIFYVLIFILLISNIAEAQKYFTRAGKVAFFSEAPLENIEAHNSKASSVMDTSTGRLEFAVLIKAFQFEKALMQQHFNENYLESDKYPKATFKGNVTNIDTIDFHKDGEYTVEVAGDLTIHGQTNAIKTNGKIIINDGEVSANSSFEVLIADYKIEIPSIVRDNIAKVVKIDVDITYQELKKG